MDSSAEDPKKIASEHFRVLWHPKARDDLAKLTPDLAEKIFEAASYKLSRAPQFIGQPLKGTTKMLWKIRFSKYRVIYTLNAGSREVWVISVGKRDTVYRDEFVQSWVRLAIAIRQMEKSS